MKATHRQKDLLHQYHIFTLNGDGGGVNGERVQGKVEGGETGLICKINEKVI